MKLRVGMTVLCICAVQGMALAETPGTKTTASSASGREMFVTYCASCHGKDGTGDGPAASALKTPPANLTTLSSQNGGAFPELRVLNSIRGAENVPAHGSAEMPVWGHVFRRMSQGHLADVEMRLSNLVAYIRSIQAK
jgi:mono/diheme cytochrome c family protein